MPQSTCRWTPHPGPQRAFLLSPADELLYGGAAGGGKSDALLAEAVPDLDNPGFHALLLRRTYPELEGKGSGLIPRAAELWPSLGGRFDRHKLLWTFPSGATVGFGHLEHPSSVYAYHSAQFAYIAFDELTTFLEAQYLYMLSRLRSPAGIRVRVRAASNPGGIGHTWVRRRFVEKLRPGEIRWFKRASSDEIALPPLLDAALRVQQTGQRATQAKPPSPLLMTASSSSGEGVGGEASGGEATGEIEVSPADPSAMSRQFIPARVFDNPSLISKDPGYVRRLKALDPVDRRRLLDGDWWVANTGAVYRSFSDDNLTDEEPADGAPIELAFDDGHVDPRAILFLQRRGDRILVADEMYHVNHLSETCVAEVVARCRARAWPLPEIAVGSPEAIELREYFRKADIPVRTMQTPIVEGLKVVRRLICDSKSYRALRVHRRCTNLLRELQGAYQYPAGSNSHDSETPLDKDNHAADALRYWVWLRARRS